MEGRIRWRHGFLLLLLLGPLDGALAGTVLTIITPGPQSHLFGMRKVTIEMAARGHKVAFLAAEHDAERLSQAGIPIITYSVRPWSGQSATGGIHVAGPQSLMTTVAKYQPIITNSCDSLLANDTVLAQIQALGAELIFGTSFFPCTGTLAYRLDVPIVNFLPAAPIEPYFTSLWRGSNRRLFSSNPLSYVPQMELDFTTQYLSFPQRLQNFVKFWHVHLLDYLYVRPGVLATYRKYGIDLDAPRERRRIVMTLCIADFAIEWLRSLPPNFKLIGPVLPEPACPLPGDLEEFMANAGERGVLYVAMGTVATLGLKERQAMAAAFAQLPARVLWRLSKSEVPDENALAALTLGNNTKVVTWAPQNDVLGHPRTRAFLSHCGVNSLYEAAYHGVPVVALPFFGDQPGNAGQAVARGFAVRVRHSDIGTAAFPVALAQVLGNGSYAAAARKMSVKLRARKRTPVQEAVDWVEHVLATGGEAYLRTPDDDLPLVVRLSLDVWAACLGAAAVLVYTTFLLARLVFAKFGAALFGSGPKAKAA
ncbi:UDP-glucuronosyltransferase 2A1 [Coccomyxa sp. Obi]|nr:UDP-glucuronosyltransferase 2A1 [Coccomyxa sp. Obi]